MMLLLAHLLTQNNEWRNRPIRLLRVIDKQAGQEEVQKYLAQVIETSRIRATPVAIVAGDVRETILQISANAAIVFVGLEPPVEGQEDEFMERMQCLGGNLPRIVWVDSCGGISLES